HRLQDAALRRLRVGVAGTPHLPVADRLHHRHGGVAVPFRRRERTIRRGASVHPLREPRFAHPGPSDQLRLRGLPGGGSPDFVVPIAILIPFLLVITLDGLRGLRETWPITLVVTLVFSLVQGSVLWFLGPELADLASGLLTMVAIFGLCRIWRPRRVYREGEEASVEVVSHSVREVIAAW